MLFNKILKLMAISFGLLTINPLFAMLPPSLMGMPKEVQVLITKALISGPINGSHRAVRALKEVCWRFRDLIDNEGEALINEYALRYGRTYPEAARTLGLLGPINWTRI